MVIRGSCNINNLDCEENTLYQRYQEPLSTFEMGESTGEVSLSGLLDGETVGVHLTGTDLREVCGTIVDGRWPAGKGYVRSYYGLWFHYDMMDSHDREFRPMITHRTVRAVASGTPESNSAVGVHDRIREQTGKEYYYDTIWRYLKVLDGMGVTTRIPAWQPELDHRTLVLKSMTRMVSDPSVSAFFMGLSKDDVLSDRGKLALLFECAAMRDLRIYSARIGAGLYRYRDKKGLQADAVIRMGDSRWGAVNIEPDPSREGESAERLLRLRDRVTREDRSELAFLAVLIPTGYSYTMPSGVKVVPIGCLRDRAHPT